MINFLTETFFKNTIIDYLIFLGIIVAGLIVGRIIYYITQKVIRVRAEKTKTKLDNILVSVIEKPIAFLLFIITFDIAYKTLTLSEGGISFFSSTVDVLTTISVAWFIIAFVDALIINYIQPLTAKTESDLDDTLLPIVRRLVRAVLIIIAAIIIVDKFGYNVTSLIAGLGIGGLAFALAAQDLIANMFGGIAIITDKPFKLGDRIKIEGYDGWVREIGLRTTRVETLDGFQMIVPNSKVADSILENVSREKARKTKMIIGVEYNTSLKKLEQAKKIIRDVIKKNKYTKDNSLVAFTEFADSSLNILVIYWIKDLDNILSTKDDVNTEIKKEFEKAKVSMAFPTRTVYLKK